MIRREFIGLLGGAAVWPVAVGAQQAGKLPTIGFLGAARLRPGAHGPPVSCSGCTNSDGSRVALSRWSIAGRRDAERYAEIAAEFVRLKVGVIVTTAPAVRSSLGSISSWRRRMNP